MMLKFSAKPIFTTSRSLYIAPESGYYDVSKLTPPGSLIHKENGPPLPPSLHPECILTTGAWDIAEMRGCHRKLWENVMEVIVKIEKTKTMTNTWGKSKTKTKTDKDKNLTICLTQ